VSQSGSVSLKQQTNSTSAGTPPSDPVPGSPTPTATEAISHLRKRKITLIYERETQTLRTNTPQEVKITIDPAR
jgi:hypothetical protein